MNTMINDFYKVIAVINSCKTYDHHSVASKMVDCFSNKHSNNVKCLYRIRLLSHLLHKKLEYLILEKHRSSELKLK